jgi:hypothetical protein
VVRLPLPVAPHHESRQHGADDETQTGNWGGGPEAIGEKQQRGDAGDGSEHKTPEASEQGVRTMSLGTAGGRGEQAKLGDALEHELHEGLADDVQQDLDDELDRALRGATATPDCGGLGFGEGLW